MVAFSIGAAVVIIGFLKACKPSRSSGDQVQQVMSTARDQLLAKAPIGSTTAEVMDELKKQGYDSNWKLDDSTLTAVKSDALNTLTLKSGPSNWQLRLYCDFANNRLTRVRTDMWPTGM